MHGKAKIREKPLPVNGKTKLVTLSYQVVKQIMETQCQIILMKIFLHACKCNRYLIAILLHYIKYLYILYQIILLYIDRN